MSRSTLSLIFAAILCFSYIGCPPTTTVNVPNVGGMTQSAASAAIVAGQLTVGSVTTQASLTVAAGLVISQNPAAGARVVPNSTVNLVISTGPAMVNVPNVGSMTQNAATAAIVAAQLTVGTVTTQDSPTVEAGRVISQNPAGGASVSQNSAVALVISTGWVPSVAWNYTPNYSPNTIVGHTIDSTSDGGFVISGGNGGYNMYALKLNANGGKAWDHTYSNMSTTGTPSELWRSQAAGIRETTDGYVLLGAGHNENDQFPDKSYLLVKLNSQGVVQSSQAYAPWNPYATVQQRCVNNYGGALQVTADGGFMAVGESYVGQYSVASILKTDSDGGVDFLEVVQDNDANQDNHPDYDQDIMDGQQTSDDGYVLTGYSGNGHPAGYVALLIKLNSAGMVEWSQVYNYPPQDYGAMSYCVTETANGDYLIAGELINWINNNKALYHGTWIARVDGNGDEIWSNSYASIDTLDSPNDIVETPQGDFLTTGHMNGHFVLSKFTAAGAHLWNYEVNSVTVPGKAMVLTPDGGCVILASGGSSGAVVVKINHVFIP